MNRRNSLVISLIILITVVLSACAPSQPPAAPVQPQPTAVAVPATAAPAPTAAPAQPKPAETKKVELVFRQGDPPGEVEGLLKAVEKWNAANPDIQVKMETVPWSDAQAQYVREVQAGGGPDVAQIAFVWTADLGKSGLLNDLTSRLKSDPPGKGSEDMLGYDLGDVGGKVFGVPWTTDTNAIAYRPDLLEKAGITAFPETWEDFLATAKKLSVDTNGDKRTDQYGFCFPGGSAAGGSIWFLANYYLWSNGKYFVEPGADGKYKVGVTPEDVAGAMKYFQRFFKEGATPESMIAVANANDPEIIGGLGRGDCAMAFLTPSSFRAAQKQSQKPLATAMIPKGSVKRISHLGGRTLAMNPKTKYPDQAWKFIKYLTGPETFATYQQFPAQKSVLAQMKLPDPEKGYQQQLPFAETFKQYIVSGANTNSMWEATNREFGAMLSGQKTAEQASQDLVKTMGTLLQGNK